MEVRRELIERMLGYMDYKQFSNTYDRLNEEERHELDRRMKNPGYVPEQNYIRKLSEFPNNIRDIMNI